MEYKSTCSYCGVGCGIIVKKDARGKITVHGDKDHPGSKGMLCSKGRNLHYVAEDHSDRILYPQMRLSKNHPMQRVTWDTAINRAARVFKSFINKFGPDSVAFYVSGQCLTEEYYLVNKLCKGFIGTNNIDTNSRLCMSSAVVGYKKALGEDAVPISYDDIELADTFFITGANPAWCHPILFRRLEAHKRENPDIKIIVADPRKTQTCALADIHLQINPGTDVFLNNAICKYLIDHNLIDTSFTGKHTNGFETLKEEVNKISLEEVASICGVKKDDIELAARYIGKAKGYISMWAMGLNQSINGVDKNLSLLNISLITGKIGKPGSGPFSLTGQPNAMGGREVGGMANLLPAHRELSNPEHRKEVARFWDVKDVPGTPGYTATEMFDRLADDKLKAIWIICTNPLVSMPNVRKAEEALKKSRFVVVQEISHNSITSDYADLLLPAAGWLEKEGTMTNSDRRISYLEKVNNAPGEALSDSDILIRFAKAMGYNGFNFKNPSQVFDEHCKLTQNTNIDISGLDYETLKNKGSVQWPFTKNEKTETKRLFNDFKFYTPDKKANIIAVRPKKPKEKPIGYSLILTTGRIRDQWHTMTKTGKVQKLNQHIPSPFLEIHPDDASLRDIDEGDMILITGEKGEVKVEAKITKDIKKGVIFLPMHWGKIFKNDFGRANNLTSGKVDPVSKEPDFKLTNVEVIKWVKPKEQIVLVGAGAAAYKFIETYKKENFTDKITVFSAEKEAFYNRVLLPDYINGEKNFDELLKLQEQELKKSGITLHRSNRIKHIDPKNKTVTDSNNIEFGFDKLILCTGSSPRIPDNIDHSLQGVFSLRSKKDADYILKHLDQNQAENILVVGGGLLGLESASSLYSLNKQVTLVHRNSRLMDKQLDYTAAQLLSEQIINMGITVLFNDEIEELTQYNSHQLKVQFKSGKNQIFDGVIFAIGTIPNLELAKNAGIATNRAVMVNERLETKTKNIFALGEMAELNGQTWGITLAAEEQAIVLAHSIAGNPNTVYTGSISMNILKFPGIELCSIGMIKVPDDKKELYEEIVFSDLSQFYYKKCIIHNDRLVGALLMGDKSEFSSFKQLIQSRQELGETRKNLLRSGQPVKPVKGKLICSCNNVGKGNIQEEIINGYLKMEDLCQKTGAGTGCGSCKPEVGQILQQQLADKASTNAV